MITNTELCNAIIYRLQQQGHGSEAMNCGHLIRVAYLLNIIHYLNFGESIVDDDQLSQYTVSIYGPFNKLISENFDGVWEQRAKTLADAIQTTTLVDPTDMFTVEVKPFDWGQLSPAVQQTVTTYAEALWSINPEQLCDYFADDPQVCHLLTLIEKEDPAADQDLPYSFAQSVKYFTTNPFWKAKVKA